MSPFVYLSATDRTDWIRIGKNSENSIYAPNVMLVTRFLLSFWQLSPLIFHAWLLRTRKTRGEIFHGLKPWTNLCVVWQFWPIFWTPILKSQRLFNEYVFGGYREGGVFHMPDSVDIFCTQLSDRLASIWWLYLWNFITIETSLWVRYVSYVDRFCCVNFVIFGKRKPK